MIFLDLNLLSIKKLKFRILFEIQYGLLLKVYKYQVYVFENLIFFYLEDFFYLVNVNFVFLKEKKQRGIELIFIVLNKYF